MLTLRSFHLFFIALSIVLTSGFGAWGLLHQYVLLGVLSLAKKHGPAVVDEACAAALELQVPTYRFVRRFLERQPALQLTLKQVDPLIRELTHYRDLIDRQSEGDPRERD